jgi:hypothetical protein
VAGVKRDAIRAKKRADAFLARAKELLVQFPTVTQSCPNLPPSCVRVDNTVVLKAIRLHYITQFGAIKRFTNRLTFVQFGATRRDTAAIRQARDAVSRGNANLDRIAPTSVTCSR